MADKKISQLTALSAANLAPSTDVLAIVDTSATETKKIAAQDIVNGVLNVASAVGIGTSTPSTIGVSGYTRLVLGAGGASTDGLTIVPSGTGGVQFTDAANVKKGYLQWDASTGALALGTAGTTKATLTSGGNFLVGTTSGTATITANASGGASIRALRESVSATNYIQMEHDGTDGKIAVSGANALIFATNSTNQARITSGGDLLVGTTDASPVVNNVAGINLQSAGVGQFSSDGNPGVQVNRKTNDGDLVVFRQDGTTEGTISVSGNTVSYNAFAGSHWSQLQDGSKPDILRGTVMESINELCVWPDENNERLPKSKVSDTAGSKKVYGVFMAWDNDWTETNDMYVTAVGAFICRVNASVTVQEGDLLESNGDGTARVQADDIIRSSTIGKVTSTVKTHQYDDGSYCVPTVLYCG